MAIFGLFIAVGFIYLAANFVFSTSGRLLRASRAAKVISTSMKLKILHSATTNYYAVFGRWPSNMTALAINPKNTVFVSPAPPWTDGWGGQILYTPPSSTNTTGHIMSLGADGVPGGTGVNADIQVKIP